MDTERERRDGGEVLFELQLEASSEAPAEVVYDLLADLEQHVVWGGRDQRKGYRLASMEASPGAATVGTEFRTRGIDPGGTFDDTSVVTEATRGEVFEFVTEARQRPKRGGVVEWTLVHRYELAPREHGSSIRYRIRVVRLSKRAWFTRRGLRTVGRRITGTFVRRGLMNLARMADERVTATIIA